MTWHCVGSGSRIEICNDYQGRPGGVIYIGSTALAFRAPRQGSHRGEKMIYRPFSEQDRANAYLIAAAPELLEAVRAGGRYAAALNRYQDHGVRGVMIPGTDELERLFKEWSDRGFAAIAKAEGR